MFENKSDVQVMSKLASAKNSKPVEDQKQLEASCIIFGGGGRCGVGSWGWG